MADVPDYVSVTMRLRQEAAWNVLRSSGMTNKVTNYKCEELAWAVLGVEGLTSKASPVMKEPAPIAAMLGTVPVVEVPSPIAAVPDTVPVVEVPAPMAAVPRSEKKNHQAWCCTDCSNARHCPGCGGTGTDCSSP